MDIGENIFFIDPDVSEDDLFFFSSNDEISQNDNINYESNPKYESETESAPNNLQQQPSLKDNTNNHINNFLSVNITTEIESNIDGGDETNKSSYGIKVDQNEKNYSIPSSKKKGRCCKTGQKKTKTVEDLNRFAHINDDAFNRLDRETKIFRKKMYSVIGPRKVYGSRKVLHLYKLITSNNRCKWLLPANRDEQRSINKFFSSRVGIQDLIIKEIMDLKEKCPELFADLNRRKKRVSKKKMCIES